MRSEALSTESAPEFLQSLKSAENPAAGSKCTVDAFCFNSGKFHEVSAGEVLNLSISEICNSKLVLRFNMPGEGRAYFVAASELYDRLTAEGKLVRWLQDLFTQWRREMISLGYPEDVSIYHLPLADISTLFTALVIFKPARVVEVGK
jgi:hypothetical protein